MGKHLYISLSSHGFGHLAQTSTVIKQLLKQRPKLKITIQCGAEYNLLRNWFNCDFDHQQRTTDFGMLMDNAVDVQKENSLYAYRQFHHNWEEKVLIEAENIKACKPDLLFSNISYLALAAAKQAQIPSIALCSLNWADIFAGYSDDLPEHQKIYQQMLDAYQSARYFLQPAPSMAMSALHNSRPIAPIARLGRKSGEQLKQQLGIDSKSRLTVIGLGGIPTELPIDSWPISSRHYWLIPDDWSHHHPNAIPFSKTGLAFIDMLASSDALITKPGYGSIAEAVCNNVPVIYLPRHDWPEEPYLLEWLHTHGISQQLSRERLYAGDLTDIIDTLSSLKSASPPYPEGARQAAEIISQQL